MEYLIFVFLFIVGSIFGSFWSVVLTRFGENISRKTFKDFLFGRSECPNCHNTLKAKNLIPFFSYIFQWWKCEYCNKKISIMYPLLELFSGLIFVVTYLVWLKLGNLWYGEIVFRIMLNRWLLLLLFWDFLRYELHFIVWIFLLVVSLLPQFFWVIGDYKWAFVWSLIFGWAFYLIYFFSNRYVKLKYNKKEGWFWMWDVFFAFFVWTVISFVLSYNNLSTTFSDLFVFLFLFVMTSSLIWLVYGLVDFAFKRGNKKEFMQFRIPFLPSMIIAFWILLFFGKYFYTLLFF
mgnify:CR=1 FL=1